jgi:hypothetical protein
MDSKRTLAEGGIDYLYNGIRDAVRIGIRRLESGQPFERDIANIGRRAIRLFFSTNHIGGSTRMGVVVGAFRERTGNDDRRLDSPKRKLACITDC